MFEIGDIVFIKSLEKEGMILNIGTDLETNETKYCVVDTEKVIYFIKNNDIIKIDTLEERLEEYEEENSNHSQA